MARDVATEVTIEEVAERGTRRAMEMAMGARLPGTLIRRVGVQGGGAITMGGGGGAMIAVRVMGTEAGLETIGTVGRLGVTGRITGGTGRPGI